MDTHTSPRLTERVRSQLYALLQRLRGRPLMRHIRDLELAEQLPPSDFNLLHEDRVSSILDYAKKHVPLYRTGQWTEVHTNAATHIDDWPVLERSILQAHNERLMAIPKPDKVDELKTSGTTGKALRIVFDRDAAVRGWAHRYRGMQWHEIPIGARALRIAHDQRPWRNAVLGQFCVWPPNSPGSIEAAFAFLKRNQPTMVAGPPSALFYLARQLRERGVTAPLAPYARVGGEQLFQFQRTEIESILGARVINSYGTTESGPVAGECRAGNLHVYADHLHLEIFDGNTPAKRGEFGDIVLTTLHNKAMPLVRYRIGDSGRISTSACECGLPHPVLQDLQARSGDVFLTSSGQPRHVSILLKSISQIFENAASDGIRTIQFQQVHQEHWDALIEISNPLSTSNTEILQRILETIVSQAFGAKSEVSIRPVEAIPHVKGKFNYYRPR